MYTDEMKPTITPENATFASLFLEESRIKSIYYVPNFQRSYAWDVSNNVDRFLEDLKACYEIKKLEGVEYQHFLGQIILRHAEERETGTDNSFFEIIDGQQRLATFFLVCIMLHEKTTTIVNGNSSLKARGQKLINQINMIIKTGGQIRLQLSKNDQHFWNDLIDFYTVFHGIDIDPGKIISHIRMKEAAEAINAFLDEESNGLDDLQKLVLYEEVFQALLTRMHLITVTSEPTEYMFSLFQTVNDRGRLLTSGELLRAKTLEALKDDQDKQLQAEKCWDDILSDDEKTTNLYLEWCYISFTGKVVEASPSLFHQYIKNYFVEAQKRHLNDVEIDSLLNKIQDLKEDVTVCRLLKEGSWPFRDDSRPNWQKERLKELLVRMRHTKAAPILLSAASRFRKISPEAFDREAQKVYDVFYQLVDLLDRFFFVYIKISRLDEKNFQKAYCEYAQTLRDKDSSDIESFQRCLAKIEKAGDCQEILKGYLSEPIYANKRVHTIEIHLLYLLEIYYQNPITDPVKETMDDAMSIDVGNLSIEHIYPRNASANELVSAMEPNKNKIGNLTLLGKRRNNELDDKLFHEKKAIYQRSPYRQTNELGLLDKFDDSAFQERQNRLVELSNKVLSI